MCTLRIAFGRAVRRPLRFGFCAILVLLAANPDTAWAQCPDYAAGLHWVGYASIGGSPDDMTIVDSVLYAAWGTGFAAFDLSNPEQPELLATIRAPGWSRGISVAGTHAYIASTDGLHAIDIAVPGAPVLTASTWTFGRDARDVAVACSHAYVADGTYGISVFDIGDPASPRLVKGFDFPGVAEGVAYGNSTLFVASGDRGLTLLGLENPTRVRFVASLDTPGDARKVALAGSYAYVADSYAGLQIVDVADPTQPRLVAAIDDSVVGSVCGVDVEGTLAYVASDGFGVTVLDVTDPSAPRLVTRAYGSATCVIVDGANAYVGQGVTLDVLASSGNEATVGDLGAVGGLGAISDVATSGPLAFVTEYSDYDDGSLVKIGGLHIVDVADRERPHLVGSLGITDGLTCIAVSGASVFAGSGGGTLRIFDVSTPGSPDAIASVGLGSIQDVAVSGTIVCAGGAETGLHLIDVSDPRSPRIVATIGSLHVRKLAASGPYVYVLDGANGFVVVDASDPADPVVRGSVSAMWGLGGFDIGVAGAHVYVSTHVGFWDRSVGDGFWVIDVADPAAPTVVGHVPCPPGDLALDDRTAYVSTQWGLVLIDITRPTAPAIVGGTSRWDRPYQVAVDGSAVYVGATDGLRLLPVPCDPTPVSVFDLAAEPRGDGMRVHWRTSGSEFIGFEVRRAGRTAEESLGRAMRQGDDWEFFDASAVPGETYTYRVRGFLEDGSAVLFGPVVASLLAPEGFGLGPARPFPARDRITISFTLSGAERVRLEVYDARGRRVRQLLDQLRGAGRHVVDWDGRGDSGERLGNGLYFVHLSTARGARTTRAAIVR